MKYATIVENNESGLNQIIRAAEKFEESRFLQGIQQRCYTAEDIQWATDRVREYQQKLNTEARALAYFSEHFLKQYATNNNQCFEMAQLLLNRIRSTLKATRKVFKEFCPIRRRQQPANAMPPSVYERSALSQGACHRDLFGIMSYEDSVQADGKVIFLRKLERGGSEHSFGIHVAEIAGMPKSIVKRANEILKQLEENNSGASAVTKPSAENINKGREGMQLSFFQLDDPVLTQVRDEILGLDVNNLTPLEALNKLNEIKKIVSGK